MVTCSARTTGNAATAWSSRSWSHVQRGHRPGGRRQGGADPLGVLGGDTGDRHALDAHERRVAQPEAVGRAGHQEQRPAERGRRMRGDGRGSCRVGRTARRAETGTAPSRATPRRDAGRRAGDAPSCGSPSERPRGPRRRGAAPRARAPRRSARGPGGGPRPSGRSRRRWWRRPCSRRSSRASPRSARRRPCSPRQPASSSSMPALRPSARGSSGVLEGGAEGLDPGRLRRLAARARISASVAFTAAGGAGARANDARATTSPAPRFERR